MNLFINNGVSSLSNFKIFIIIGVILFVLAWSLWMNFVMMNIGDIQSITINNLEDEICRLNKIIESYGDKKRACWIP